MSLWISLAVPIGVARADVELADLASIVMRHQITHPRAEDIPVDNIANFDAYLAKIDKYAARLTKDEYAALLAATLPKDAGIGGAVVAYDGRVRWIGFRNGPALAANVPPEGELVEIDQRKLPAADLKSTLKSLIDTAEPSVRLRFSEPARDYSFRRERVAVPVVEGWPLQGTAFVRVFSFVQGSTASAIQSAVVDAADVILDMRFCDGGNVYEALDSAGIFLDPGLPIGGVVDAEGNRTDFVAPERGKIYHGPVTILTSPITASAAELFIAALQFHNRVSVVGTPTYGKCEAQKLFPLSNGGALRISVERVLRPSGEVCESAPIVTTQAISRDRIFDTPWILEAIHIPTTNKSGARICEGATFLSRYDAAQRDAEVRLVVPLIDGIDTISEPDYPLAMPEVFGHRLCYGPMKDQTAADELAKQLSEMLGQPFKALGGK